MVGHTPARAASARLSAAALICVALCSCLGACATQSRAPVETAREPKAPPKPRLDDTESARAALPDAGARPPAPPVGRPPAAPRGSSLPSPGPRPGDAVLYRVGARTVGTGDLGDFILRYFPDRARDALAQLVDHALIDLEAAREGVTVDADAVRQRAAAYVEERRKQARIQYGEGVAFETLLREKFGRDASEFARDAERLARAALLRDRLVRLEQLREDRVEVRAVSLGSRAAADRAAEQLRGGADMTLLARRLGLAAPSAPPPLAREQIEPAALSQALFAAQPGDVLDPLPFEADGSTFWQVVKVVTATTGRSAGWAQCAAEVERSVAERPVGVPEYLAWRRRALARHPVEVLRGAQGLVPWLGGGDR